MTLADFLLARIAEDEAVALSASEDGGEWRDTGFHIADNDGATVAASLSRVVDSEHIARHDPARVLAECASKRRIVEYVQVVSLALDGRVSEGARCVISDQVIQMLAAVYGDHPDYREEWRP